MTTVHEVGDLARRARHALFEINPERLWGEQGYLPEGGHFARTLADGQQVSVDEVQQVFVDRYGCSAAVNGNLALAQEIAGRMNALVH